MYDNLDIVFLTGLFPKESESDIIKHSKKSLQNAANNLQWEFVRGIDMHLSKPLTIFNSLYIGSFPFLYEKLWIKTYRFSHSEDAHQDMNIGFCNLLLYKNWSRYHHVMHHLKKWAKHQDGKQKVLIAYAMTSVFTKAIHTIKKQFPQVMTYLIVPDLPQYMNLSSKISLTYRILKQIEIKSIQEHLKSVDGYVFLTKHMADYLSIQVPFVVIEGMSTSLFQSIKKRVRNDQEIHLMYSGGLNEKYGVKDLIDSFMRLINPQLRLFLCGSGELEDYIKSCSYHDERIVFLGLLKREDVLTRQKNADYLINPRMNTDEFAKYSFPSKILEYLSSGTPVIASMLSGIPEDYLGYFHVIDQVDDGLYQTMEKVLSIDYQVSQKMAASAIDFVQNFKNNHFQTQKLLNMIEMMTHDD
jgi:glycosyltransferase involved in cell wall biosynthesis